jgi:aspartate-semialdehyde dehydrogenase
MAKKKTYRIAVVGATGLVGQEMLAVLEERQLPIETLLPLASARSAGETVRWGDADVPVQVANPEAFAGIDLVLMSAGSEVSKELAPAAAAAGAVVIDNSAAWRGDAQVPLVVPEVNAADLAGFARKRIVANPNCSTIQMMVALGPLHAAATLRRVVVSTYQAVSGAGKEGIEELSDQVRALYNQGEVTSKVFAKPIAFNCVPRIDRALPDGYTAEERKMRDESRRILHAPDLGVCATCVRVPVFSGHALSITAEFAEAMTATQARDILRSAKGVLLQDDLQKEEYPTQIDVHGSDATHIGRLRDDPTAPHALAMWCVADNLRKGAATNAVQIAEILLRDYLA